jgi:hypothetical protein
MAADRRTLMIGVLAMVGLVLIGVVSGSLFARSACADIAPQAAVAPAASGDLELLVDALGPVPADQLAAIRSQLDELTGVLGPVTGVAAVPGASGLAATGQGVAVVGSGVVALTGPGDSVDGAVSLGTGTAVGDGPHLYSLALTNPLTGQVDALQPLDASLTGLTCQDTALVGSPLAFHLAAGDGQLLLLRIDEDGDDPELELRDPVAGQVWSSPLLLPMAPAGLAGARLTAGLGPEVVVAGTRTTPGEDAPVLTAVDRRDGSPRWSLQRAELAAAGLALSEDGPTRAEVAAVGDGLALVVLRAVDGAGRADEEAEQDARAVGPQRLVAVATADGSIRWDVELEPTERVAAADSRDGAVQVVLVDPADGSTRVLHGGDDAIESLEAPVRPAEVRAALAEGDGRTVPAAGSRGGGIAALDEGGAILATGGSIVLLAGPASGATEPAAGPSQVLLPAIDVVRHPGGVSLLLLGAEEQRAVITYAGIGPVG